MVPPREQVARAREVGRVVWTVDRKRVWGAAGAVRLSLATGETLVAVVTDLLPPEVVRAHEGVEDALASLGRVEKFRGLVKGSYLLNLTVATLLVLVAAVWLAFYLARRITSPILHLTEATERVADGDLDFRLTPASGGEIGRLVRSFSRMVEDLKRSRAATEAAHAELRASLRTLEGRNEFIETILANIGSGVVSLDAEGRVLTLNPAAREMLPAGEGEEVVGRDFRAALGWPEVAEVVARVAEAGEERAEGFVAVDHDGGERRLRVTARALHDEAGRAVGTVVVLHDYTELVRAQKMAAWREVARRIAHEIKNPLTPIRLATQRLRRKLARGDPDFAEAFEEASRIILEEVTGLERLVSEFSEFSRMAEARLGPADLHRILDDALELVDLGAV
ncbi:MAG: HAMP domain-containing protein, partial [Nitrospirae bacterium]